MHPGGRHAAARRGAPDQGHPARRPVAAGPGHRHQARRRHDHLGVGEHRFPAPCRRDRFLRHRRHPQRCHRAPRRRGGAARERGAVSPDLRARRLRHRARRPRRALPADQPQPVRDPRLSGERAGRAHGQGDLVSGRPRPHRPQAQGGARGQGRCGALREALRAQGRHDHLGRDRDRARPRPGRAPALRDRDLRRHHRAQGGRGRTARERGALSQPDRPLLRLVLGAGRAVSPHLHVGPDGRAHRARCFGVPRPDPLGPPGAQPHRAGLGRASRAARAPRAVPRLRDAARAARRPHALGVARRRADLRRRRPLHRLPRRRQGHHRAQAGRSRAARGAPGAQAQGGGARALERGARAVRLRRLARPAGAAAHGVELHAAPHAPLRRPLRRRRARVHGLRGRRRGAHEAAHRGPARLLARRHPRPGIPPGGARGLAAPRHRQPARGDRGGGRRRHLRRAADHRSRRPAAHAALPEPDRQRAQVPLRLGSANPYFREREGK